MQKVFLGLLIGLMLQSADTHGQPVVSPAVISIQPDIDEVVKLDGVNIGFLRARRGVIRDESGALLLSGAVVATERDPLGPTSPGIVYNYSMQLYGLVSGELSFELKPGVDPRGLAWAPTAAPKVLVAPHVYVVNVTSGAEFLRVFTMLQKSTGVRWVEPSIRYVPEVIE
jgi:hypothetical protein